MLEAEKEKEAKTEGWWHSFYQDTPFIAYLDHAHAEMGDAMIDFIVRHTGIKSGERLFDQCCGVGSVSLPFAARGVHVTGVDLCPQFIEEAGRRANKKSLQADYHLGDATTFQPQERCHAAINIYTSFGYADDATNRQMLVRAREALLPGAAFILDYPNMYATLGNFRKHIFKTIDTAGGAITVTRASHLDHERGRLLQVWTFIMPDGKRVSRDSSLAIYLPHQIREMLESAGFKTVELYGGLDDEPLAQDNHRCLAVAR